MEVLVSGVSERWRSTLIIYLEHSDPLTAYPCEASIMVCLQRVQIIRIFGITESAWSTQSALQRSSLVDEGWIIEGHIVAWPRESTCCGTGGEPAILNTLRRCSFKEQSSKRCLGWPVLGRWPDAGPASRRPCQSPRGPQGVCYYY
jgi:hypothetical protein